MRRMYETKEQGRQYLLKIHALKQKDARNSTSNGQKNL